MDAITSYSYGHCSSKACADDSRSSPGGAALLRKELSFSRSRKVFHFLRVLRLASRERLNPLRPAASNAEACLETSQNGIEEAHLPKTVRVRFQLKKWCQFGEQFLLVGDDPVLGSWDPSSAIPLNWSDGNLWTLDLDMPTGRPIQFKFILKGVTGINQWQPDPDRVLKTWETDSTITVCEDWEDASLQRITEGLPLLSEEPTSETQILADNLSPPVEQVIHGTENGSAFPDVVDAPAEILLEEARDESLVVKTRTPAQNKSVSIVTEITTRPLEKLSVEKSAGRIQSEDRIGREEISGRTLEKEMAVAENVPGNNPAAKAINGNEGDLVAFHEGPVLVPGLTPSSMAKSAGIVSESEAADPKAPELKGKEVPNASDQRREEGTAMVSSNHEKQLDEKQKEAPQFVQGRQENEAEEDENVDPAQMNVVLKNDIRWGRKTLRNFLANLGLLI